MADNHNHDDDYAMGMELFDGDMEGLLAAAPPPAPTSHLEPHLLESFPPLEQREEDPLEEALEAAVEDERLSEEQAFALLVAAERGDERVLERLVVQKTASPIFPGGRRTVLVVKRSAPQGDDTTPSPHSSPPRSEGSAPDLVEAAAAAEAAAAPPERVSVVFQSVVNARQWWSPDDARLGVASRPLGPRKRGLKEPSRAESASRYKGKLFCLLRRAPPADASAPPAPDRDSEVWGAAQLLQFWEETSPSPLPRCDALGDVRRSSRTRKARETTFDGAVVVQGDLEVQGAVRCGSLHTERGAQDYAEWFPWAPALRDAPPPPGSVVRLAVDEQGADGGPFLELDANGDGPLLITSTRPSLAAGGHGGGAPGANCAFLGVLPVRCVGPVRAGDALVPAGADGTARAAAGAGRALGVALRSRAASTAGDAEALVDCIVRWEPAAPAARSAWADVAAAAAALLVRVLSLAGAACVALTAKLAPPPDAPPAPRARAARRRAPTPFERGDYDADCVAAAGAVGESRARRALRSYREATALWPSHLGLSAAHTVGGSNPSAAAPRPSLGAATFALEPVPSPPPSPTKPDAAELDPAVLAAFVAAVRNRHSHRVLPGSDSAIATICSSNPTRFKPRPRVNDLFVGAC